MLKVETIKEILKRDPPEWQQEKIDLARAILDSNQKIIEELRAIREVLRNVR